MGGFSSDEWSRGKHKDTADRAGLKLTKKRKREYQIPWRLRRQLLRPLLGFDEACRSALMARMWTRQTALECLIDVTTTFMLTTPAIFRIRIENAWSIGKFSRFAKCVLKYGVICHNVHEWKKDRDPLQDNKQEKSS